MTPGRVSNLPLLHRYIICSMRCLLFSAHHPRTCTHTQIQLLKRPYPTLHFVFRSALLKAGFLMYKMHWPETAWILMLPYTGFFCSNILSHLSNAFCPTLFRMITASWFAPVMLNVSPDSPSRMVYSSLALSPKSASVAEIRPTSAPGTANSDTENSQEPETAKRVDQTTEMEREMKERQGINHLVHSSIIPILL